MPDCAVPTFMKKAVELMCLYSITKSCTVL